MLYSALRFFLILRELRLESASKINFVFAVFSNFGLYSIVVGHSVDLKCNAVELERRGELQSGPNYCCIVVVVVLLLARFLFAQILNCSEVSETMRLSREVLRKKHNFGGGQPFKIYRK